MAELIIELAFDVATIVTCNTLIVILVKNRRNEE